MLDVDGEVDEALAHLGVAVVVQVDVGLGLGQPRSTELSDAVVRQGTHSV